MKQYVVDAFTSQPFAGNPAAVCVMESWPTEAWMMALASENNLSETAFVVPEDGGYRLRWFTPACEVEICGHATLASGFVVLNFCEPDAPRVVFHTMSGDLAVGRAGDLYELDFPTFDLHEVPVTDAMEEAFGARPVRAVLGLDLVCEFADEQTVRAMEPDQAKLALIEGRIQNATAAGSGEVDCVSRSFCPKLGIPEDPVCGSAHCHIADYWSRRLGKPQVLAYQASKRGGYLTCTLEEGGRIRIAGPATLVGVTELAVQPR